jgi:uncharacterized membrane protein YeaQ/YmgE (transglycosylase-associated protein family)
MLLYLSVMPSDRGDFFVQLDILNIESKREVLIKEEENQMSIIAWIVLGLIAGALAKAIYPGHQGGGIFATIALGIVGALVGGYLGQLLLGTGAGASVGALSLPSILFAVLGAMLVIFIWGLVTRRAY